MTKLTAYDKFMEQARAHGFSFFGMPKTGQTVSYRTGDDGDLEKGYPVSGARFKDNGDGTITEILTGLMWVKQPENIGGIWVSAGEPVKVSWNDAIDNCNALVYAGHSDWRLPNLKELFSIVQVNQYNPCVDTVFFPNTQDNKYWTSSTYSAGTTLAWNLYFRYQLTAVTAKTTLYFVRPVRGGA